MRSDRIQPFIDEHPGEGSVLDAAIEGLSKPVPTLPPWLFYDEEGSHLFDAITKLPEYYLTRTEQHILAEHGVSMAERLGAEATVVEFGSGSSLKTTLLLDALKRPRAYMPVDISRAHLLAAADRLSAHYPALHVLPVCADYNRPIPRLARFLADRHAVVFFPGSTIGNFTRSEAVAFLRGTRTLVGPQGRLLIGFDLRKPVEILLPAYDDAQGITARFNLNMLVHVNRVLGPVFDVDGWRHRTVWNEEAGRIEMRLVASRPMDVVVESRRFRFDTGAEILTEYSHKYRRSEVEALLRDAGFTPEVSWSDDAGWFLVVYAERTR